jgi:hypothetical protein
MKLGGKRDFFRVSSVAVGHYFGHVESRAFNVTECRRPAA